jgi:sec-independent protein translocase protein TatA
MSLSTPHLLVVAAVMLVLFGRGRLSATMGEFGSGLRSFRKGLRDEPAQTLELTARTDADTLGR